MCILHTQYQFPQDISIIISRLFLNRIVENVGLTHLFQTSGEAEYVGDIPALAGQLCAVFVKSTRANAAIAGIDCYHAATMSGVSWYVILYDKVT